MKTNYRKPVLSFETIGMVLGYILWYTQLVLILLTIKIGQKTPKLHQVAVHSFTYTNYCLLLGQKIKDGVFFSKLFRGLFFGYFGHYFGWMTLVFKPENVLSKIYLFDKIRVGTYSKITEVSIFSSQNNTLSLISEGLSSFLIVYSLIVLNKGQISQDQKTPSESSNSNEVSSHNRHTNLSQEMQSKLLDTSPMFFRKIKLVEAYTPVLVLALSNFIDSLSKVDHLISSHERSSTWAIVLLFFVVKFILVCLVIGKIYFNFRRTLGVLEVSKLDMFSIHTGLGFQAISEILKNFDDSGPTETVRDKLADIESNILLPNQCKSTKFSVEVTKKTGNLPAEKDRHNSMQESLIINKASNRSIIMEDSAIS